MTDWSSLEELRSEGWSREPKGLNYDQDQDAGKGECLEDILRKRRRKI